MRTRIARGNRVRHMRRNAYSGPRINIIIILVKCIVPISRSFCWNAGASKFGSVPTETSNNASTT